MLTVKNSALIRNDVKVCDINDTVNIFTDTFRRWGSFMYSERRIPYSAVRTAHKLGGSFAKLVRMILRKPFRDDNVPINRMVEVLVQMLIEWHESHVIADHSIGISGAAVYNIVQYIFGKEKLTKIIFLSHIIN